MFKKLLAGLLVAFLLLPLGVSAETLAEQIANIQAQITSLQSQLQNLQNQQANSGSGNSGSGSANSGGWCYTFNNNLSLSDFGTEVARLHQALKFEGYNGVATLNPQLRFSYDVATTFAINWFQNKYRSEILTPNGLTNPTGNFGNSTRAKMNQLYGCNNAPAVTTPNNTTGFRAVDVWVVRAGGNNSPIPGALVKIQRGNTIIGTYGTDFNGYVRAVMLKTGELHSFTTTRQGSQDNQLSVAIPQGNDTHLLKIVLNPEAGSSSNNQSSTPTVFVTSPTGGSYEPGDYVPVSWQISNSPVSNPSISIQLLNNSGSAVDSESDSGTNDSKSFHLSNSLNDGQYRFRVSAVLGGQTREAWSSWFSVNEEASDDDSGDDNSSSNSGSNNFTPSITITSPTYNANWSNQTGHTVTWTTTGVGMSQNLTMELFTAANQPATNFNAFTTSNDFSESMSLATVPPGFYYFRLKAVVNGQTIYGGSGVFQLTGDTGGNNPPPPPPPPPPNNPTASLFVTNPSGGSYQPGSSVVYSWVSSGLAGAQTLNVKVLDQSGTVMYSTTATNSAGSGTLTLPNSLTSGQYRLRIFASIGGVETGGWSSWFTVTATSGGNSGGGSGGSTPVITITSPTYNANWSNQTGHTVTWTTTGVGMSQNLTMELFTAANQPATNFNAFTTSNDFSESMSLATVPPGFYYFRLKAVVNGQTIYGGSGVFQLTN